MNFDRRKWDGFDDIVQSYAGETKSCRVDDCAVDVMNMRLKRVNQYTFVIRLQDRHFHTCLRSGFPDPFIDVRECLDTVDARLATSEKVGVRPVQHQETELAATSI